MRTEEVKYPAKTYCDMCGTELVENYGKNEDIRYLSSKYGDGINLMVKFETKYNYVTRSGKCRRTARLFVELLQELGYEDEAMDVYYHYSGEYEEDE